MKKRGNVSLTQFHAPHSLSRFASGAIGSSGLCSFMLYILCECACVLFLRSQRPSGQAAFTKSNDWTRHWTLQVSAFNITQQTSIYNLHSSDLQNPHYRRTTPAADPGIDGGGIIPRCGIIPRSPSPSPFCPLFLLLPLPLYLL